MQYINNRGNRKNMGGDVREEEYMEFSVLSARFFCKPETVKKFVNFLKKE